MGAVYDALLEVSPYRDGELLEGYRVYESALEGILTPKQLATYAEYIRHSKLMPNAWHCADCHHIARFRADTIYFEEKPPRGILHQRTADDIPLGPINVPMLDRARGS